MSKKQNPFLVGAIIYDKEYAIKRLREEFKKGDTVFTQLFHVSQSGMTRHIGVRQLVVDDNKKAVVDKNTKSNPKSRVYNKKGAKNQKIINAAETCPTKAIIVDNLDENQRIYPY